MSGNAVSADPPPVKARLSFLAPEEYSSGEVHPRGGGAAHRTPPANSGEWLQLATQALLSRHPEMERRAIGICEEAASVLLDEADRAEEAAAAAAARRGPSSSGREEHRVTVVGGDDDAEAFSPREEDAAPAPAAATAADAGRPPERLQAAYVLIAGSVAALARGTSASVARAGALAERACAVYDCAQTHLTLAVARLAESAKTAERGAHEAARAEATAAATAAAAALLRREGGPVVDDDASCLVRCAWVLAVLGEEDGAKLCVNELLSRRPGHLMGLLLMALLHTSEGDDGGALAAVTRLLAGHPTDVAGGLLLTVLRQRLQLGRAGAAEEAEDTLQEELAVSLARVRDYAERVAVGETFGTKRTLRSLCVHAAPGEDDEHVPLTVEEAARRAGGYWALFAALCFRLGATPMAELAVEAGLDLVATTQGALLRRPMADLLCTRARLALLRLWEKLPPHTGEREHLRALNLLSLLKPPSGRAAGSAALSAGSPLPLRAEVRGAAGGGVGLVADASRLLNPRDLGAISTHLVKAAEVCPEHAEARHLMGVVSLLESAQPDLPRADVDQARATAASFFKDAIRLSPTYVEPLLGLGCVREMGGAVEMALDVYMAAAELEMKQPIVPFEHFFFLFQ